MKQLDIKKIYDRYDQLSDPDKSRDALNDIAKECMEIYETQRSFSTLMARVWDECVHFYEGDQHLRYSNTLNIYQPIPETKYNKFIPRPVTNYVFPITNTMVSLLTRTKPQISVVENSDKAEDINRAKLADKVLDAKWEMDKESLRYAMAAKIMMLVGTVYRKDGWDESGLQTVNVPINDEMGNQIGEETLKLGDNSIDILSPFEVIPDWQNAINSLDDGMYVAQFNMQSINWIKENYDKEGDGYTGLAKEVKEDKEMNTVLYYFQRLKGSTGHYGQIGEEPELKDSCLFGEIYIKPNNTHEQGLQIVIANNKCLYCAPSKYTYSNGKNWHPYTMARYEQHPFRHHGISMVEQIVPIQKRINSIDALVILNRMTMAIPQWLIPIGCLVKNGYISGAPGLNIEYKAGVGTPAKIQGMPLDPSVYKEREEAVMTIHALAGDNEVLQGNRPAGVGTAAGLQILLEQAQNKFVTTVLGFEKFIEESQTKKINIIRRFYKEPRATLINRIKAMNDSNTAVEIDDLFNGKSLGDNLDVRVETGSTMPRSKVAEQQNLKDLAAQQIFGPLDPMNNPMGNKEFLRRFDVKGFPVPTAKDVDRATWENDLLRQSKFDEVEVLAFDDPVIHFRICIDAMKGKEFYKQYSPEVVQAFLAHALGHFIVMMPEQIQMLGINQGQQQQLFMAAQQLGVTPQGMMPLADEVRLKQVEQAVQQLSSLAQQGMQAMGVQPPMQTTANPSGSETAPVQNQQGIGGGLNNNSSGMM